MTMLQFAPLIADIEELHAHVESTLAQECRDHPRLLVFLCGTALMHSGAVGHTSEERIAQAQEGSDPSLADYAAYVPTEGTLAKLQGWSDQGAEILYLTYHRETASLALSSDAVVASGFPRGAVLGREEGEAYEDVVQRARPDVLIEDDCMSTGAHDIAYHQLGHKLRESVNSIIVPEFGGLAHLPSNLDTLLASTA